MKYRLSKFFARSGYAANTTIVIDLNMINAISNIIIWLEAMNSQQIMTASPCACISKIELVDGSDVLYSLNGYEAEALDWYHNKGQFRANYNVALNGQRIEKVFAINFGRWLWDQNWAFDPQRFGNPQLRISLDIAAGGNAASDNYITCFANMFDEVTPSLQGFLMSKQIKTHAIASGTHYYTDLPLDYPYRALYYRTHAVALEASWLLANLKLSEDQDRKIPIDVTGIDLVRCLQESYPPVKESFFHESNTINKYLYHAACQWVTAFATRWANTGTTAAMACYAGEGGRLETIASAIENYQVDVKGWIPHGVFEVPFGRKDDPSDAYDIRGLGSLRSDMTGGNTGTASIFLQQYRPY